MMRVVKRNGDLEDVSFDKVLKRIKKLSADLNGVNVVEIAQKVCGRIFDGVCTRELDELTAQMCSSMIIEHPDYGTIAARIAISNHHKTTSPSFSETVKLLHANLDSEGVHNPLVSDELMQVVKNNWEKLNSYIDYSRDYLLDYFGFKTLEKSYLMRVNGRVIERPQHMWMRVAIGIHGEDLKDALQTYDLMSQKYFTHATPTLFNAGTPRPQCSSCYLHAMNDDSVAGIFQSLAECAQISKYSGGIGMHIHDIRCKGSVIRGTNGVSDGIIPMLRVFNNTARYINQCFLPDTMVYTDSGIERMDKIAWGERLVTHDGSSKPVNSIAQTWVDDKKILIVTTCAGALPVQMTPEHEVFVWQAGTPAPRYVSAKDIAVGDLVGYPIPKTPAQSSTFSEDDCRFHGMMLRCGYVNNGEGGAGIRTRTFEDIEFVERYLVNQDVIYRWSFENGVFDMFWKGKIKGLVGSAVDGMVCENDRTLRREFWNLPEALVHALLEGMFGTHTMSGFMTPSYGLAAATRMLMLSLGVGCKVTMTDCMFCVDKDEEARTGHGLVWTPIQSIDRRTYTGYVYDFNMIDNHNYTVVDLGLVHNSGKRNGSIAVYLEPWHGDIEQFLDLRKNHGNEEERCRDLFLALWIPDLFMKRVEANDMWSLMCPDTCKGLSDTYGEEFDKLYEYYEARGMFTKRVRAHDLWFKILESQIETGTPYMLFKDAANNKSNQKNLGTIKSSNLCVTGDTMLLTSHGYYPIASLKDKDVDVWNGEMWSPTVVRQTGQNQHVLTIQFSNGMAIRCTPYHRFYVEGQDEHVEAKDLMAGQMLRPFKLPVVKRHASYVGDICSAYKEGTAGIGVPLNKEMYHRIEWLEGFVDHYGAVTDDGSLVCRIDEGTCNLEHVSLLLHTLGVNPTLDAQKRRLYVDSNDVDSLGELGFESIVIKPVDHDSIGDGYVVTPGFSCRVSVLNVTDMGQHEDTFCFTEQHRNMGVFNGILAGNCIEIVQYSSPEETAVCNLASVGLPTFVRRPTNGDNALPTFDFDNLHRVVKIMTKNLNKIIDKNFYPIDKARRSNMLHRPIGIGVQGLADVFALMRYPFESSEARGLNRDIFETIYHASLEASMEISQRRHEAMLNGGDGVVVNEFELDHVKRSRFPGAYVSFEGSPVCLGELQFDMWGVTPSNRYDWARLKLAIGKYGVRNSLLVAPMPTASTAQVLGNNESFEPFTSNIFKRKTMSGEFIVVNKYLLADLIRLGIWNNTMKDLLMLNNGSVQNIDSVPDDLKDLYKTVWEIKQKAVIDMCADRGAFVDQSQSMNLFVEDPDYKKLTSMHFYSWRQGLKCALYYLRTRPKATTQQFTVDPKLQKGGSATKYVCNDEVCTMCSA